MCNPSSEMFILPFICANSETLTADRVFAAVANVVANSENKFACKTIGAVSCGSISGNSIPYVTYDDNIREMGGKFYLIASKVIDGVSNALVSNSGEYTATIENNGNFVVTRAGGAKVWESGATPFINLGESSLYRHRVRINMRGHLVVETTNMWSKTKQPYMNNLFVQSWSTQPIGNNFTVGVPRRAESTADEYLLILDNFGRFKIILYPTGNLVIKDATITSTITTASLPTITPGPSSGSIMDKCKNWMTTYKIDPFVSWRDIENNTNMQTQWVYYDCACFGAYIKYGVEVLRTNLGKWGTLEDKNLQKQYTESYCNCPVAKEVYNVIPGKTWGSLNDATLKSQWKAEGCDANLNREPFNGDYSNAPTITPLHIPLLLITQLISLTSILHRSSTPLVLPSV